MKKLFTPENIIFTLISAFISCSYLLISDNTGLLALLIAVFVIINLFVGVFFSGVRGLRLRICAHGTSLLVIFCVSATISLIYHSVLAFFTLPDSYTAFIFSVLFCIVAEAIIFYNGIACVYLTSFQLGIKLRVIGALFGLVPILNIIMLRKIILTTSEEIEFEAKKDATERARCHDEICKTRYPILLVHGFFFRDYKYFNSSYTRNVRN